MNILPAPLHKMSDVKVATSSRITTASPKKLDLYKRFLTRLLSPSAQKRTSLRKKFASEKTKSFEKEKQPNLEDKEASEQNFELGNQTAHDLNLDNSISCEASCSSFSPTKDSEPLYATVQKKKHAQNSKLKQQMIEQKHEDVTAVDISPELPARRSVEVIYHENDSSSLSSHSEHLEEKDGFQAKTTPKPTNHLQRRLKLLSSKNKELSRLMHSMKKEAKWKEETEHAKLRNEITKLEIKTKNEVNLLCERIKALDEERKLLSDHVQSLHEEKQCFQRKYSEACKEKEKMISAETLAQIVAEQKKLLTDEKTDQLKEISRLKILNKTTINERNSLAIQLELLQSEINTLRHQNQELEKQQREIKYDAEQLVKQIEVFKKQENEAQHLLSSLLQVAENIEMERDVLLNKATFHDHLHGEIQTSVMDYGLNIGRLQEHLLGIKRNFEELEKTKFQIHNQDEYAKHCYEEQVDILRGKVLNRNNVIKELETEKSELKRHLDNIWKTSYDNTKIKEHIGKELTFVNI